MGLTPNRDAREPGGLVERRPHMSLTSMLYKTARLSATTRAATRGPKPLAKRAARITIGRSLARTGIFRWPK